MSVDALEQRIESLRRLTGVIKTCSCGRKYTLAAWLNQPFAAFWKVGDAHTEMRHCSCKSTMMYVWRKKPLDKANGNPYSQ